MCVRVCAPQPPRTRVKHRLATPSAARPNCGLGFGRAWRRPDITRSVLRPRAALAPRAEPQTGPEPPPAGAARAGLVGVGKPHDGPATAGTPRRPSRRPTLATPVPVVLVRRRRRGVVVAAGRTVASRAPAARRRRFGHGRGVESRGHDRGRRGRGAAGLGQNMQKWPRRIDWMTDSISETHGAVSADHLRIRRGTVELLSRPDC